MKYVEVVADAGHVDTVSAIAEQLEVSDFRVGHLGEDGCQQMRLLVPDNKIQDTLDKLQRALETQPNEKIVVLPIEVSLPKLSDQERKQEDTATATRETLYTGVEKNSHLDTGYVLLVFLSTIVAAVGLIKDNVAVIIGAMVIAPLLGPNLALGLGTALGDVSLMVKSTFTTLVGIWTRFCSISACIRCCSSTITNHWFVKCSGRCHGGGCIATACSNSGDYAWL